MAVTISGDTGISLATGVSGNLPVTNLNSGTSASSSTFWRGDGTWVAAGASAATPTALGTVYGSQTSGGGTPYLTAIGYNAGLATTGVGCTAVGVGALTTNSSGANHTAIGYRALLNSTVNDNSTAVGFESMLTTTTGNECTAVGYRSLYSQDSGYFNTAIGVQAAYNLTSGTSVTAVGHKALFTNGIGEGSTALGFNALYSNTTASNNVAVGYQALYSNVISTENTAVGYKALYSNVGTTGYAANTACGHLALTGLTTGYQNAAFGFQAGKAITGLRYNYTAIGFNALVNATTGYSCTALGSGAGEKATTAANSIYIGTQAGTSGTGHTTGDSGIYIGTTATSSAGGAVSELVISPGQNVATGKGNYTGFIFADTGGLIYQGNNSASWATTSDRRLKKNIVDNNIGLEKLTQIQVRNFEYRVAEEVTELPQDQAIQKTGVQLGVIAQELQAVLPECVKQESTGVLSVDADNLTWYMINAIKELKADVDSLKSQLNQGV